MKTWLKLWWATWRVDVYLALLVLALLAACIVGARLLARQSAARKDAAVVAAAPLKVSEAGMTYAQDAVKTLDAAGRRDRLTITVQQENARALAETKGADAPLDPELVGALRLGLCRYAAYAADPGCAEVRGRDPAVLP